MSTPYRTRHARAKLRLEVGKEIPTSFSSLDVACGMGLGLLSGAGHKVKALKLCRTVMRIFFPRRLPFPPDVSLREQQVSNGLSFLTHAVTASRSLPHACLRSPAWGRVFPPRCQSHCGGSPRPPPCKLARYHGVRWEVASEELEREKNEA